MYNSSLSLPSSISHACSVCLFLYILLYKLLTLTYNMYELFQKKISAPLVDVHVDSPGFWNKYLKKRNIYPDRNLTLLYPQCGVGKIRVAYRILTDIIILWWSLLYLIHSTITWRRWTNIVIISYPQYYNMTGDELLHCVVRRITGSRLYGLAGLGPCSRLTHRTTQIDHHGGPHEESRLRKLNTSSLLNHTSR